LAVALALRRTTAAPAAASTYSLLSGRSWRTNSEAPAIHGSMLAEPSGPVSVLDRKGR
jgi:hypothetical protein